MWPIKLISILLVLTITLLSGAYPFIKRLRSTDRFDFPIGESLAAGVFLGAGLMHMLGDASHSFYDLHYEYPIAFLIAGLTFLFFLWLEHVGQEIYHHQGSSNAFALLAVTMLSIHSFFAGAALGLSNSTSITIVILLAILAHKWAASFALAVQINKSQWNTQTRLFMFAVFACMVPLGIVSGTAVNHYLHHYPLLEPIFASLAAGTFLYLGTLHGLDRAVMIKQCCNLKGFSFVIMGFSIMAIVAIWT